MLQLIGDATRLLHKLLLVAGFRHVALVEEAALPMAILTERTGVRHVGLKLSNRLQALLVSQGSRQLLSQDERMAEQLVDIRPHARFVLKAAVEEVFELRGDATGVPGWLVRLGNLCENLEDDVVFVGPGRLFRDHLIHGAAERPNISKPVVAALLDDFRCHPIRGAAETLRIVLILLHDLLRTAEVSQLAPSIASQEDVCSFDVPVNNVVVVEIL